MTWVKVNRNTQDLENEDLEHYTDMLVDNMPMAINDWFKLNKHTVY